MTDFYTELNLDRKWKIAEINAELSKLESIWKRREIYNPEKATAMQATINQARKAFASEVSRSAYDRELARSGEKPATADPNAERRQKFTKWCDDARAYFDSKQYDLAKTAVEKALSYSDPSAEDDAFFSLAAEIYRMNRNYPTALENINKAIIINPEKAVHYILKAGIQREQASASQGYNNLDEVRRLIQNARNTLTQAVNIAHRCNDRQMESAAYGLLAYYHYFIPQPDVVKAEEYAEKSVEMGDVWGNASKVLDDIKQKRQKEAKAAEERKKLQEQQEREAQNRQEQQAQAERKRKQREQKKKTLYTFYVLCWIAFFAWFAFALYMIFKMDGRYGMDVDVIIVVFLLVIAAWVFLEKASNAYSAAPKVLSFVCYGGYLFGAATIKYTQWGYGAAQAARTWKFVGINILVLIAVVVTFSLIGKAVRNKMK